MKRQSRVYLCASALVAFIACKHEREPALPPVASKPSAPASDATADLVLGIDVPETSAAGLEAIPIDPLLITVSPTAVSFEGRVMVAVNGGSVDPKDKEGSRDGIWISALRMVFVARLDALRTRGASDPFTFVAFDKATSMSLASTVLESLRPAFDRKERTDHIAVRSKGTVMALPIVTHANEQVTIQRNAKTYHPIVSVSRDKLWLGSTSSAKPDLELVGHDPKPLVQRLREIVTTRWPDGHRTDDDHKVLVNFDAQVTLDEMAPLLAALRMTDDGKELFPNVLLWWPGFESGPEDEAARWADLLVGDGPGGSVGDMSKRPGADLGQAIGTAEKLRQVKLVSAKALETTSLTAEVVAAKINASYLAGIQRCYLRHIRVRIGSKTEEKIAVDFMVAHAQPLGNIKVRASTHDVDSCVAKQVAGWKFPKPDADTTFQLELSVAD